MQAAVGARPPQKLDWRAKIEQQEQENSVAKSNTFPATGAGSGDTDAKASTTAS